MSTPKQDKPKCPWCDKVMRYLKSYAAWYCPNSNCKQFKVKY